MLNDVISVKAKDDFLLYLEFENGEKESLTVKLSLIKSRFNP